MLLERLALSTKYRIPGPREVAAPAISMEPLRLSDEQLAVFREAVIAMQADTLESFARSAVAVTQFSESFKTLSEAIAGAVAAMEKMSWSGWRFLTLANGMDYHDGERERRRGHGGRLPKLRRGERVRPVWLAQRKAVTR